MGFVQFVGFSLQKAEKKMNKIGMDSFSLDEALIFCCQY